MQCLIVFSHPDYTVGPGTSPGPPLLLQQVAGSTADRELGMLMRSLTLPRRHISMRLFFSL
jgi:hypothetical protein